MISFGSKPLHTRFLSLTLALVLLASIFTLSACSCGKVKPSPDPAVSPGESEQPPDISENPSPAVSTAPAAESASPTPVVPTKPVGPSVPECEPADDAFFSDAAFMGNSLMNGFELYSGLTTPDYYTATSMTVIGAQSTACIALDNGTMGTMVDGLCQKPYGKIYILLGINEIGLNVEDFIASYGTMLDTIIAAQGDACDIYITSITPVSAAKNASGQVFNMDRIYSYNTALYALAEEKGCYYLDLVSALAGPDGFLPADQTFDGVHFTAELYQVWLNYVRTHHV